MRLLKIRNPWGRFEWKGEWCDTSDKWTDALRLQFKHEKKDDGVFFMAYEDYISYFTSLEVCKINDAYKYSSLKTKQSAEENHSIIKFLIEVPGKYYFTVCQKDKRQYHNKKYKYSRVRMTLC